MVLSCSLLTPSDNIETPEKIVNSDPFNWSDILAPADFNILQFSYYTDVFHEDYSYVNSSQVIDRITFISRLTSIISNYDSINVSWENNTSQEDPSFENVIKVELRERDYKVETWLSNNINEYSGTVNFIFEKDTVIDKWFIKEWRDINDNSGVSFFHPDFK